MQGEYRGDFSRDTFKQLKHYCRVLGQQGRMQLEADGNEQTAILLHLQRSLAADLIGPHGGPQDGFAVAPFTLAGGTASVSGDFLISPGHYYVDGTLCELESVPITVTAFDSTKRTVRLLAAPGDGIPFQMGQYVSLEAKKKPNMTIIEAISPADGSLTLKDVSGFTFVDKATTLRRLTTYGTQPHYLPDPINLPTPGTPTQYLVYLDVWERHLTCLEDDSIREVALGGPDTATRAKVVWQVKTNIEVPATPTVAPFMEDDKWSQYVLSQLQPENRGLLKARVTPGAVSADPCTTSPESRYRGPENQLYRVEIHQGGTLAGSPPPSFKWSRENGSVAFPIAQVSGTKVTLENLGRDRRLGLKIGDYVEVVDDESVLHERVGPLFQVADIKAADNLVELEGGSAGDPPQTPLKHPLLRRWDQKGGDSKAGGLTLSPQDNAAQIIETQPGAIVWLDLEDGIQIQFPPGANYRSGDYWLIPARTATGGLEWPQLRDAQGKLIPDAKGQPQPLALPPHGVEHHYAPLAIISVDSKGIITVPTPLRRTITPIAPPV